MSIKIKSESTSDELKINTDKEAMVALTKDIDKAGYAILAGENHDGGSG